MAIIFITIVQVQGQLMRQLLFRLYGCRIRRSIVSDGFGRLTQPGCSNFYCTTARIDQEPFHLPEPGQMYLVEKADSDALHLSRHLPMYYSKQLETLTECAWMCRRPLMEVVNCLKVVAPSTPNLRLVLWGKFGTGKSMALLQTAHYALKNRWVVFYVYSAMNFTRTVWEIQMSVHKPGRIDTPQVALRLLQVFKSVNAAIWEDTLQKLTTERDYHWTKNETTPAGSPITDIVDMGITAPYLATDCVGALLRELKRHANEGSIRVLMAMDDANSLFGKTTVKRADKTFAKPKDMTLAHQFRKALKSDWTNGICVLVADKKELSNAREQFIVPRHTPLELFGEEGFEAIDPCIPIEMTGYSPAEMAAMHEYYCQKNWLTSEKARSSAGLVQMMHISGFNPFYFERMCRFL